MCVLAGPWYSFVRSSALRDFATRRMHPRDKTETIICPEYATPISERGPTYRRAEQGNVHRPGLTERLDSRPRLTQSLDDLRMAAPCRPRKRRRPRTVVRKTGRRASTEQELHHVREIVTSGTRQRR